MIRTINITPSSYDGKSTHAVIEYDRNLDWYKDQDSANEYFLDASRTGIHQRSNVVVANIQTGDNETNIELLNYAMRYNFYRITSIDLLLTPLTNFANFSKPVVYFKYGYYGTPFYTTAELENQEPIIRSDCTTPIKIHVKMPAENKTATSSSLANNSWKSTAGAFTNGLPEMVGSLYFENNTPLSAIISDSKFTNFPGMKLNVKVHMQFRDEKFIENMTQATQIAQLLAKTK